MILEDIIYVTGFRFFTRRLLRRTLVLQQIVKQKNTYGKFSFMDPSTPGIHLHCNTHDFSWY